MKTIIKTIKVSEKGQIALPKDVRESAEIGIGDNLILIQRGGKIMLEKAEIIESKTKDDFKDLVKISEMSLKSLWDNEEDDIWNSYLKKK